MYDESNDGGFMGGGNQESYSQTPAESRSDKTIRSIIARDLSRVVHSSGSASSQGTGEPTLDGKPVNHFKIVGRVERYIESETNFQADIHDGTGLINVRYFLTNKNDGDNEFGGDNEDEHMGNNGGIETDQEKLEPKQYYSLLCRINVKNDKNMIYVVSFKKVDDYTELLYHQMEALYQHLYFTRGPRQPGNSDQNSNQNQQAKGNDDIFVSRDHDSGVSDVSIKILNYLRQNKHLQDGIAFENLARATGLETSVARTAIAQLLDAGSVLEQSDDHYSTL